MTVDVDAEELESLRTKLALYEKIFQHTFLAEKFGNHYFICGEGGSRDKNGMPDRIHVCPAMGLDWFHVYRKTDEVFAPEW